MRGKSGIVLAVLVGGLVACEQVQELRGGGNERGRLALSLQAPETLNWGEEGMLVLGLENQGGEALPGAMIELHMPTWLEFASVEPAGTTVTLQTDEDGTRLTYRVSDLQPGERRGVTQHVRVPAPGRRGVAAPVADGDTLPAHAAPTDRVVRARLLDLGGRVIGAEVQAVLAFRGAPATAPADTMGEVEGEARVRSDGVGRLRLGMTVDQLRRAVPQARDTVLATGVGAGSRAMLVPVAGGRHVVAGISDRGVDRILVREPGVTTDEGLGVGSQLGELRASHGEPCTYVRDDGRVVVWFRSAPGVRFTLDERAEADAAPGAAPDPARLPGTARVVELSLERGAPGDC